MQRQPLVCHIFSAVFAVCCLGLVLISLLRHDNPYLALHTVPLLLCTAAWGAVLVLLWRHWDRRGHAPRHEACIVGLLLALYFALLLAFGLAMQVRPQVTWDFPTVSLAAQELVLEGSLPDVGYFYRFPNNTPLLWVYVAVFRVCHLFGAQHIMPGLVVLNCVCITAGALFLYLAARRLFGRKWAPFILCGALLCPGIFLYAPIAYTDTLTLPFVSGAFWLWLEARQRTFAPGRGRTLPWMLGAFAVVGAGALLKVTVAILAVAFVLDALLLWPGRARFGWLAAGLVLLMVLRVGGAKLAQSPLPPCDQPGIPYTHWVMMGLHGNGGYYDPDYEATLAYPTYAARAAFNRQEIARRLREMGLGGFLDHCAAKLAYIISDGTCYAPTKLDRGPACPNVLHGFIVPGAPYSGFLYYWADAWQLCLLGLGALGAGRRARPHAAGARVDRGAGGGVRAFAVFAGVGGPQPLPCAIFAALFALRRQRPCAGYGYGIKYFGQ